jgi:hypothetical protein
VELVVDSGCLKVVELKTYLLSNLHNKLDRQSLQHGESYFRVESSVEDSLMMSPCWMIKLDGWVAREAVRRTTASIGSRSVLFNPAFHTRLCRAQNQQHYG